MELRIYTVELHFVDNSIHCYDTEPLHKHLLNVLKDRVFEAITKGSCLELNGDLINFNNVKKVSFK